MANTYDRGDLVRTTATFIGTANVTADPSQIWCLTIDGRGVRATHRYGLTPSAIFRGGTGGYYLDIDTASASGDWAYRWEGTGIVQQAEETAFNVRTTFKL